MHRGIITRLKHIHGCCSFNGTSAKPHILPSKIYTFCFHARNITAFCRHACIIDWHNTSRSSSVPAISRGFTTSAWREHLVNNGIVKSPYPALNIQTDISLPRFILNQLDEFGDSTALIDGVTECKISYRQLKTDIIKVASALTRLGLRKGEVVTIFAPNCIEWAQFYIAAGATGAVVSAVNQQYTTGELAHALSHSHSKYIITIPELIPVAKTAREKCPDVKDIIVFGECEGCIPFSRLLADDGTAFPEDVDLNPSEDLMALPYSSGTTGLPKGVMLTHTNIVANVQQLRCPAILSFGIGDILLGVLPFFHIYGQVVVLLSSLRSGSTIVTLPKFDPELFLRCIELYKVTYLHVVPPIALFLAKHPVVDKFDLSSIKTLFVGAAPIGADIMLEVMQKLDNKPVFRQGYGLTEASPVTHCHSCVDIKLHTIGQALPNTEYKVVDLDSGEPLEPNQEGELCVRGPQIMKGYFKNQEATDHTIKDGWLHTGDIGYYDNDDHMIISDRLKELIKVKGFQVAPAELEALLVTHPAIQDAAVIGKPDDKAGELPIAYVVIKPNMEVTEQEVRDFLKDKVAPFKQLGGGVKFRSEIPKSASGKILRRYLKEELLNEQQQITN